MKKRVVAPLAVAAAGILLLGTEAKLRACSPYQVPKTMELVASYPGEGGMLAADRDIVLVFSIGSFYTEDVGFPLTFPPQGFAVWDESRASPTPVAVEVIEKKPQESKWDGIGLPVEVREWGYSGGWKSVIRMYRLKAESGWTVGTTYRLDFQYGDVSGMEGPPFPEEPVWIPHSVHFTAGAPAGPLTVPAGELHVDFLKEYAECREFCEDGCAMTCYGGAMAVQRFHLSSYGLTVDGSTGPLVIRFHSSGSDLQDTGLHATRSYIVLPGETQSPLDLIYLRGGPILYDGYVAGDGCEVCLAITVEAPDGTILDAPAHQCLQAYQAPKPDEPCDPDDWGGGEGGESEPPALLHWPVCGTEIVEETGGVDVFQPDADALWEGLPDLQSGTPPTDAQPGGDSATAEGAAPAGSGDKGCSSTAAAPAGSVWLSMALLLSQLLIVQGLRGRSGGGPAQAAGAAGRYRKGG